jgi:hypothetical protein
MIFGDYDTQYNMESSDIFIQYFLNNFNTNWEQASILSDYMGKYYSQDVLSCTKAQHKEVFNNISYVLNELFENAIKFNEENDISTSIQVNKEDNLITLVTTNHIHETKVGHFVEFLSQLFAGDPKQMFMQKIEQNLMDDSGGSGLGYLTLILNFDVKLGFRFFTLDDHSHEVKIYTMARMPMLIEK